MRVTNWQPIETAPKDGTHLLLALRDGQHTILNWIERSVFTGHYQTQGDDWVVEGLWAEINGLHPTYWMPLADPPGS